MSNFFDSRYPTTDLLQQAAKRRIPRFAYDYLIGGCIDEIGLQRNIDDLAMVQLRSHLLTPSKPSDSSVELFGHRYAQPFGIAPIGLQGLMWPKAPEILARAAKQHNIPYVLSTVSSSSLERIAEVSEGHAWYQLYNPTKDDIRRDLLQRIETAGYPVLVVTVDVPTFGYRFRDIMNGLAMPPKMTLSNILQMLVKPQWLWHTAVAGKPEMETLKPYMPKNLPTGDLAAFMNDTVMGPVHREGLKPIRDFWKGPLVIKGVISPKDIESAIELGADAVVISNHGGRQLDSGESSIVALQQSYPQYQRKIKLFMDSGLRSGSHIASSLASGADFTFLGRAFVFGVGALGDRGGHHTINMLTMQLAQILAQLGCERIQDLPQFLVR